MAPGEDRRLLPPKTDPSGRYKGTNYDPDFARKKYGASAGRRDNRGGPSDKGHRGAGGHDGGGFDRYAENRGYADSGYNGNGYGGGQGPYTPQDRRYDYRDSKQGYNQASSHFNQSRFSTPSSEARPTPPPYTLSAPAPPSGVSIDDLVGRPPAQSPSHWSTSSSRAGPPVSFSDGAVTQRSSAPEAEASNSNPAATAITPVSSAVSATINAPGMASPAPATSSTGEISSLEKLKLFKAQVEASRQTRAQQSGETVNITRAAESFLQSVASSTTDSPPTTAQQLPTGTSSTAPSQPDEATIAPPEDEDGEIPDSRSRAQLLKERLRLKIEQRKTSGMQGNGTPGTATPIAATAAETPVDDDVPMCPPQVASVPEPPTQTPQKPNGPSQQQQSLTAETEAMDQAQQPSAGWSRSLEERLGAPDERFNNQAETPGPATRAENGRYAEAARQRHEARNNRMRASASPPPPRRAASHRHGSPETGPTPPRDHFHWTNRPPPNHRERSPEPRVRRESFNDRRVPPPERYAERPPPPPPPRSEPEMRRTMPQDPPERIVYDAPAHPVVPQPRDLVITPTTAWVVKTLQLLKEQILELEKLIDPAVMAAVTATPANVQQVAVAPAPAAVQVQPPQPTAAPPPLPPPPPPPGPVPREETSQRLERNYSASGRESQRPDAPPSEYDFNERREFDERDRLYKSQYNKPGYNSYRSSTPYDRGYAGSNSSRGRGGYGYRGGGHRPGSMERGPSSDGNKYNGNNNHEWRGGYSRDW